MTHSKAPLGRKSSGQAVRAKSCSSPAWYCLAPLLLLSLACQATANTEPAVQAINAASQSVPEQEPAEKKPVAPPPPKEH